MATRLYELAHLVPDLATYGYQHGAPCDPGPDWSSWNAAQIAAQRTVRPDAAVAGVVTTHARLLKVVAGLDDAGPGAAARGASALRRAGGICSWPRPPMSGHMPRISQPTCAGARTGRRAAHAARAQGDLLRRHQGPAQPGPVPPAIHDRDRALQGTGRLQPAGGGAGTAQPGEPVAHMLGRARRALQHLLTWSEHGLRAGTDADAGALRCTSVGLAPGAQQARSGTVARQYDAPHPSRRIIPSIGSGGYDECCIRLCAPPRGPHDP
jgi:hypothetical protein